MTFKMKGTATDIGRNYLPGMGADLSDLEGLSAIVVGTDIPFGFMLWYGSEVTKAQSVGALNNTSIYRGKEITVMLPFKDGDTKVTHQDGTPYTYAEFQLDPATNLPAVAGVGVYSSHYNQIQPIQSLGLGHDGDSNYGQKNCDSITFAREGRIFVYAETDMNIDSRVGYRVAITDPLDESQCRGGFGDLDDIAKGSELVAAPKGFRVVKPSKAGGLAVIEIDF